MDQPTVIEATAPIGKQLIANLRERIVNGDLPPGARLSEQEVAAAYNLSRQPVREAFIKLAASRLVEIRPQRGTYVCKIDLHDVTQSQFVREAVEADIARAASIRADEATVATLRGQLVQQADNLDEGGRGFIVRDEHFHQTLAIAAERPDVWRYIQPLKMQMDRVRHLTAEEFPLDHLVVQHSRVVEAIAAHDADGAEAAIRLHLRGVLDDVRKIAATLPHYFEGASS